jgi:5'-deoxynucleotidase YfbR-like HD superfamily hydrolase
VNKTTRPRLTEDKAWIQTFTGQPFWPLDPRPEEIDILDIAHALSMQCRYSGHVHTFYSVAEHSVHISRAVDPRDALWGLLHDASEAYLVDIPRPLKPHLPQYKAAEQQVMQCIVQHFNLYPVFEPAEVKEMDTRILFNEREALLSKSVREWGLQGEPIPNLTIRSWQPAIAEIAFLERFAELTGINPRREIVASPRYEE